MPGCWRDNKLTSDAPAIPGCNADMQMTESLKATWSKLAAPSTIPLGPMNRLDFLSGVSRQRAVEARNGLGRASFARIECGGIARRVLTDLRTDGY
jgi:hypothetical protein